MENLDPCLAFAPIVALVISFAKRIPFVSKNPKLVATFLSLAVTLVPMLVKGSTPSATVANILAIAGCIAATLGLTVGSFELAKPALKALGIEPKKDPLASIK